MAKFIFRQKAIDDLTGIWNYTESTWSESQADKYYGMIRTACKELATGKVIGRRFDKISDGLLGFGVGKHIIFYQQVSNNEIEIIRILHERMDLENRLVE